MYPKIKILVFKQGFTDENYIFNIKFLLYISGSYVHEKGVVMLI